LNLFGHIAYSIVLLRFVFAFRTTTKYVIDVGNWKWSILETNTSISLSLFKVFHLFFIFFYVSFAYKKPIIGAITIDKFREKICIFWQ